MCNPTWPSSSRSAAVNARFALHRFIRSSAERKKRKGGGGGGGGGRGGLTLREACSRSQASIWRACLWHTFAFIQGLIRSTHTECPHGIEFGSIVPFCAPPPLLGIQFLAHLRLFPTESRSIGYSRLASPPPTKHEAISTGGDRLFALIDDAMR